MLVLLRRLLVALTVVAFVGGMTLQASPSAAALGLPGNSQADMGCPQMATHQPAEQKPIPNRGMDSDCVKQMGCLGTPSLPTRSDEPAVPVTFSRIIYSLASRRQAGSSVEPELLPPIAR